MSFGGGGGGALPNHEHTSIPLDGGPLDFVNTTIASLTAGSTTYSNGAALQELVIGTPSQALVVNGAGTAPEWGSAAAAASANNNDQSGTFSTTSGTLVDVTNMNIVLPNTGGTNDCLIMYSGSAAITPTGGSIKLAVIDNTTPIVAQEIAPTTVGYGVQFAMQTITNASGNTAKLQMASGGGTASLRASADRNSVLTAFAV